MKNNKKQSIGVNKMYHLNSFFAGIGGFDLGFEKNGFKTEFLCEINPFCNEVLSTHWPEAKRAEDICEVTVVISRRIP